MSAVTNNRKIRLTFWVFALIAGFFLVTEHKAHLLGLLSEHRLHILGALPYLLLLLCPLMHIFMHGSGGHDRKE